MADYVLRIRQGNGFSDRTVDFPDADAARQEASQICIDLIRDTVPKLKTDREWRIEVRDHSGTVLHLIRLTAESFEP